MRLSEGIVFIFPIARLFSNLDDVKSSCIINMKTSAIFKVGILQCITVTLLFSQIIIRFVVFNLVLKFYKYTVQNYGVIFVFNASSLTLLCVSMHCVTVIHMYRL